MPRQRCRLHRGLAPTTTLRKHVADLEASTLTRFEASGTKRTRSAASRSSLTAPPAGAASSASSPASRSVPKGTDTRFIVTNLAGGKAKALYADLYCRRGAAENHIKSWKTHLAADRTFCTRATANQFRLFLHAGAYWMMWGLRAAIPKRSSFAVAQFDTLRLRLIKIAARVVEMKTQIRLHLPTSCPDQRILRIVLDRIPRLVT
ncbi:transposase [Mesorhizobium sp. M1295]|uniref:transposase n=1 Tax=Mesorhizobium sp. M1295 TaxID=2957076 RepID=UPI00333DD5F0